MAILVNHSTDGHIPSFCMPVCSPREVLDHSRRSLPRARHGAWGLGEPEYMTFNKQGTVLPARHVHCGFLDLVSVHGHSAPGGGSGV